MPKQKDLKRLVRERMRKTGESYTAARVHVVGSPPDSGPGEPTPDEYAAIAEIRDAAVKEKTGRTWAEWVRALDRAGAAGLSHKEIARLLREEHDVSPWWSQSVTVGYERIRGLRQKGQRREGGFDVNKSKTCAVPVETLYRAFGARARHRWMTDGDLTIGKASVNKSLRTRWTDETPVDVYFWSKGASKSQVQLQHRELPSKERADELRAHWTRQLAQLGEFLRT